MTLQKNLITKIAIASCGISVAACAAWPFSSGPKDVRVTSVTTVDFKDQPQLSWTSLKPRPSKMILRIEFITDTDLLTLAKKKDYNVSFAIGACNRDGVKDMGVGFGYVYWNTLRIYSDAKQTPDYATAVAKGPPFIYQAYATPWRADAARGPVCFTLAGGNMMGGQLHSNDAVIPDQTF